MRHEDDINGYDLFDEEIVTAAEPEAEDPGEGEEEGGDGSGEG